jgi:hypothetical protein
MPTSRLSRLEEVRQADSVKHLGAYAIHHGECHSRSILRRINVHSEWPLPKRRINNVHDGIGDGGHVRILRYDRRKRLLNLFAQPLRGPRSYSAARFVSRGRPEWARWLVPRVKAPGTIIDVSMPHRLNSRAYCTASASIPAFAAKYGDR